MKKFASFILSMFLLTGCGNSSSDVELYSQEDAMSCMSSVLNEDFVITKSDESGDRIIYTAELPGRDNLVFHVFNEKVDNGVWIDGKQVKNAHKWSAQLSSDYINTIIDSNIIKIQGILYSYGLDVKYQPDKEYYMTLMVPDSSHFEDLAKACADIDKLLAFNIKSDTTSGRFSQIYCHICVTNHNIEFNSPCFSVSSDKRWTPNNLLEYITDEYNKAVGKEPNSEG